MISGASNGSPPNRLIETVRRKAGPVMHKMPKARDDLPGHFTTRECLITVCAIEVAGFGRQHDQMEHVRPVLGLVQEFCPEGLIRPFGDEKSTVPQVCQRIRPFSRHSLFERGEHFRQ